MYSRLMTDIFDDKRYLSLRWWIILYLIDLDRRESEVTDKNVTTYLAIATTIEPECDLIGIGT